MDPAARPGEDRLIVVDVRYPAALRTRPSSARHHPERGRHTGPSPVNRGKPGSKMHALSDANGLPFLVGILAGNTHDSEAHDRGSPNETRPPPRPVLPASAPTRRQSIRPGRPAQMAPMEADRNAHRPQKHRNQRTISAPLLGHRADDVVAVRLPTPEPPLRAPPRNYLDFLGLAAVLCCCKRLVRLTP